jgi:U3 small nucleolar ribonucleoprotein component
VTQAFTTSMEDMIRRRIKESNFSDVLPPKEAKAVSSEEGAAETDLSQEKSKQGLGEVYSEEFLAKSLNSQPEAVSKRLEQDRLEAQEYFHKVMLHACPYTALLVHSYFEDTNNINIGIIIIIL